MSVWRAFGDVLKKEPISKLKNNERFKAALTIVHPYILWIQQILLSHLFEIAESGFPAATNNLFRLSFYYLLAEKIVTNQSFNYTHFPAEARIKKFFFVGMFVIELDHPLDVDFS
jgi:hypothetical protein